MHQDLSPSPGDGDMEERGSGDREIGREKICG